MRLLLLAGLFLVFSSAVWGQQGNLNQAISKDDQGICVTMWTAEPRPCAIEVLAKDDSVVVRLVPNFMVPGDERFPHCDGRLFTFREIKWGIRP